MCNVSTLVNAWSVKKKPPPVQVAGGSGNMVVSYMFTLVNVVVGTGKHHQDKLQVVPTASASEVFALIDGRKHRQRKFQRVKTIFGTSRSRMQQPIAACTRAQSLTIPYPCVTCICPSTALRRLFFHERTLDSTTMVATCRLLTKECDK